MEKTLTIETVIREITLEETLEFRAEGKTAVETNNLAVPSVSLWGSSGWSPSTPSLFTRYGIFYAASVFHSDGAIGGDRHHLNYYCFAVACRDDGAPPSSEIHMRIPAQNYHKIRRKPQSFQDGVARACID